MPLCVNLLFDGVPNWFAFPPGALVGLVFAGFEGFVEFVVVYF